jgi:hypothetical protein
VFWKRDPVLRFSRRGVIIGEGATSGVGRGVITHRGCGQGPSRAAILCGALVAPLCLLFGYLEASKLLDVRLLFRPIPRIFHV